jgi:hypothetical protein
MTEKTRTPKQFAAAVDCVTSLRVMLRLALKHGGANAKMHVGDCLKAIEQYDIGETSSSSPDVEGPLYPMGVQ